MKVLLAAVVLAGAASVAVGEEEKKEEVELYWKENEDLYCLCEEIEGVTDAKSLK